MVATVGQFSHTSKSKMTLVRSTKGGPFRRSVIMPSKGLLNNPGENNCFMNSAVQVLWHLDVFRRSFRLLVGHACLEDCCIFCALKVIFEQFQESDESALPPDVLRNAMAKAFQDQRKFEIGRMGDAAECFENILRRLHHHIAYGQDEDSCFAKHCIPHEKFAMLLCEQTICKCGATSEQPSFFQFVNYVVASNLVREARKPDRNGHRPYRSFGEFLKVTSSFAESAPCPNEEKCVYREKSIVPTKIHRKLLNCPDIVAIGITWDTDRPSSEYVMDILDCLGKRLEVKDLFDTVSESRAKGMKLRLVGIMTYYGKHYTTFVYNSKQETWFYLDDAEVKEIGKNWDVVRDRCIRGRHQPLLVFYANQEGEPIKVTKAPQDTKVVGKEELLVSRIKKAAVKQKAAVKRKEAKKEKEARKEEEAKKEKEATKENEAEKRELERTGKRKSLKNMVGSVLSRKKSVKSKPDKRGHMKYSSDHVLSVNGREHQNENEVLSQSLDEQHLEENRFVDADMPKQRRKERVRDQTSPVQKSPEIDLDGKKRKPKSPIKSSEKAVKVNGGVPQADRLEKHLQHVKSIESKLDTADDASDYDNIEGVNHRKSQQKKRKPKETPHRDGKRIDKMKLDHEPRRFIDQGDAYADIFGDAESLVVCSIAAEKEGNLDEAYSLCSEANMRYKKAFGLQGITDKMRVIADTKFMETQNRSRLLSGKLNSFKEKAPKSADYKRDMSKTSDYGSLSDASGSPMTPAEYSVFNRNGFKDNQEKSKIAEVGGIQAKLSKDRKKAENMKHTDNVPTKSFFTLPRIKKNHQRKLSSPQPPTKSEEEQLTKLLKKFENDSQSTGKGCHVSGRSVQDLQYDYSVQHDRGQQVNASSRIGAESSYNDIRDNTRDFVIANSDVVSSKIDREQLEEIKLCNTSPLNYATDISRSGTSNLDRSHCLSTDVNDQANYMSRKFNGVIVDLSPSAKAPQGTRPLFSAADRVKPRKDLHDKCIENESDSNTTEEYRLDGVARPGLSTHHIVDPRISTYDNVNSQGSLSLFHEVDASKSLDTHPAPLRTDCKNRSLDPETTPSPASNRSSNPKPSGKKRSIFQVVIPKIFSMDNSAVSRKPKKSLETKVVSMDSSVSIETREKQYAAMLNADKKAVSSTCEDEAPGRRLEITCSEDVSKNGPVPERTTNKILVEVDSKHEESYVVDPEVAQEEVAMMTKHVTEKRLFKDCGLQSISPKSSTQFAQSDVTFNKEYIGKMLKNSSSPSYDLNNVNEANTREVEPQEERCRKTASPQKIVVASASICERHSVDRNENEVAGRKLNDFASVSDATLISSVNNSKVTITSPTRTEDEIKSLSEPSSTFLDRRLKEVEPPPRKNLDVYRSSELYKPKTDTSKEEGGISTGRPQPSSPLYHGNTLSRWTNQVDFSKSTRQLCQQCGTVTVEKPRKFCRKCQSDYI